MPHNTFSLPSPITKLLQGIHRTRHAHPDTSPSRNCPLRRGPFVCISPQETGRGSSHRSLSALSPPTDNKLKQCPELSGFLGSKYFTEPLECSLPSNFYPPTHSIAGNRVLFLEAILQRNEYLLSTHPSPGSFSVLEPLRS